MNIFGTEGIILLNTVGGIANDKSEWKMYSY